MNPQAKVEEEGRTRGVEEVVKEVLVLAIDLFSMLPTLPNSTYVDASPLSTVPWEKGEQGYHPWEQQVLARARVALREVWEDSVIAV